MRCGGGSTGSPGPTENPPPPTSTGIDVVTYHNDNARTGQNPSETTLTLANVTSSAFGKLFFVSVDGKVDAQPLVLSGLSIPGNGTHNVLYIATEHDSVYAVDADTGTPLWQVSMLGTGETTSDNRGCGQVSPEIGVTSTPVIDRGAGAHGTVYVVAMSKSGANTYFQRLHALDAATGAEEFGGPHTIQATYPGTGDNSSAGSVIFDPKQYKERAGLLLLNGVLYTTWASHCDFRPYTDWIMSFDPSTLAPISVLNVTPNGNEGSNWASGAGPAADSAGNIYFLNANGTFDSTLNTAGFPSQGDFGNAFLKLSTTNRQLAVADYFEMFNQAQENGADIDLGSGGAMVLPDLTDGSGHVRHLALGAGKDTNIYVVDRDNMGKFSSGSNNVYQQLAGALPGGIWSTSAYSNGTVYFGPVGGSIKAFSIANALLSAAPVGQTGNVFSYPGATPSISSHGASNAILWAAENGSVAALHAYDATNLSHELYNSDQAGVRDQFGAGNKFITPTIVNGKVYVGTTNGVAVFGLLH